MGSFSGNDEFVFRQLKNVVFHRSQITQEVVDGVVAEIKKNLGWEEFVRNYMNVLDVRNVWDRGVQWDNNRMVVAVDIIVADDKKKMSVVQIEDVILDRVKAWWDMTIDNDYKDLLEKHREKLFGYIHYFKHINDTHVKAFDELAWIQLDTILAELEVNVDVADEECEGMWNDLVQCLEHLWSNIVKAML
jgi:hypothetical protein